MHSVCMYSKNKYTAYYLLKLSLKTAVLVGEQQLQYHFAFYTTYKLDKHITHIYIYIIHLYTAYKLDKHTSIDIHILFKIIGWSEGPHKPDKICSIFPKCGPRQRPHSGMNIVSTLWTLLDTQILPWKCLESMGLLVLMVTTFFSIPAAKSFY